LSGLRTEILASAQPCATPSLGPDHFSHLLQNLDWEHSPHFPVACLVPLNSVNGPELLKQPRAIRENSQSNLAWKRAGATVDAVAVPLHAAVPAGDEGKPLGVGLGP
jgi:hypothetical protein